MKELDCRKQFCPVPVLNTKKAIEGGEKELSVLVDNAPARDNVKRFASNLGHFVDVVDEGNGNFRVNIAVNPDAKPLDADHPDSDAYAVFITSDKLGEGEPELGGILMKAFLNTIGDSQPLPLEVIFMNNGVKLACEGSEVLDSLNALVEKGVKIYVCGTCLNYLDILEQKKIGEVVGMFDIVNLLIGAPKVIKI